MISVSANDLLVSNYSVDGSADIRVANETEYSKETDLDQIHWCCPWKTANFHRANHYMKYYSIIFLTGH